MVNSNTYADLRPGWSVATSMHSGVKLMRVFSSLSQFQTQLRFLPGIMALGLFAGCSPVPLPVKSAALGTETVRARAVGLSEDVSDVDKAGKNAGESRQDATAVQLAKEVPLEPLSEQQARTASATVADNNADVAVKVTAPDVELTKAVELKLIPTAAEKPQQKPLSPRAGVRKGITLLRAGKTVQAKKLFAAVLSQQADNKQARYFLQQIKLDPEQYFSQRLGENFVTSRYKVRRGDTFASIAGKYLGDEQEFHVLAKLNHRQRIDDIKAGEIVSVPLNDSAKSVATKPHTREIIKSSKLEYSVAKNYFDQGEYQAAIALLESRLQQNKKDYDSRDLLVLSYTRYAHDLEKESKLSRAQGVLKKALRIQPTNVNLKKRLTHVSDQREAEKEYKIAMRALAKGSEFDAYTAFQKVLTLSPNNKMARKQLDKLKSTITESLHNKAMALYKNQKIVDAIGKWDRLLMVDPDHKLAKLYRGRALELKERLDRLPKK